MYILFNSTVYHKHDRFCVKMSFIKCSKYIDFTESSNNLSNIGKFEKLFRSNKQTEKWSLRNSRVIGYTETLKKSWTSILLISNTDGSDNKIFGNEAWLKGVFRLIMLVACLSNFTYNLSLAYFNIYKKEYMTWIKSSIDKLLFLILT